MAKVVITIDTEAATMTATVNGKAVDDVAYVSAYKMIDSYSKKKEATVEVSISTAAEDADGVRTYKHICAQDSETGRLAMVAGATQAGFDGFITNPVAKDVFLKVEVDTKAVKETIQKAFAGVFGKTARD